MTIPLGIDLGTTNSVAATIGDGDPEVAVAASGDRTIPSVVAVPGPDETDTALVGAEARNQAIKNPEGTVASIKRRMGGDETVTLHGRSFTPEEVSALILRKVVERAEASLGAAVSEAVVTVPAYFSERQRRATAAAAELAGVEVQGLLNEPTAACLAYGVDRDADGELVLVFDLGGGTVDASLVDAAEDVLEVVATDGDTELGGDDWDARVREWIVEAVNADLGEDIREDPRAMSRIDDAAREAKHTLTARDRAEVVLPFLAPEYDFEATLTRERFEEMTADLHERALDVTAGMLDAAGVDPEAVDTVLPVGGATRMPRIEAALDERFPRVATGEVHPDEAVAVGAARRSAQLREDRSDAPGTEGDDGVTLVDVIPRSLGVELADGSFDRLLSANSSVPTAVEKDDYTVSHLDQSRARIRVYQGDEEIAEENELLGEFVVEDVDRSDATLPSLAVQFDVDESGILTVTATDLERETAESITVRNVATATRAVDADAEDLPTVR